MVELALSKHSGQEASGTSLSPASAPGKLENQFHPPAKPTTTPQAPGSRGSSRRQADAPSAGCRQVQAPVTGASTEQGHSAWPGGAHPTSLTPAAPPAAAHPSPAPPSSKLLSFEGPLSGPFPCPLHLEWSAAVGHVWPVSLPPPRALSALCLPGSPEALLSLCCGPSSAHSRHSGCAWLEKRQ